MKITGYVDTKCPFCRKENPHYVETENPGHTHYEVVSCCICKCRYPVKVTFSLNCSIEIVTFKSDNPFKED